MPRWVIGGTVGGVIGIIIWVIAVMTGPSGLLWGVLGLGLSVGIGVRVATGRCGEACDLPHAAVAVCIVTVSMILAKVLVFGVLVLSIDHEEIERLRAESRTDDQAMISLQANRILTERAQRGEDVDLSVTRTAHYDPTRYPADVWEEATRRWEDMPDSERQMLHMGSQKMRNTLAKQENIRIGDRFSSMDLIWWTLASVTAISIIIGSGGSDE